MSTPTPPLRLLVVDDDRLVRTGIVGILTTADGLEVVAEAADGHEALQALDRHRVDAVLLDIQMPRLDGIATLQQIRSRRPELPVAMLTTFSDEHLIVEAMAAGALGFLLKSDEPEQLIMGVRALGRGGAAFSPRVARWLAEREHAGQRSARERRALDDQLTARQRELLTLIGHGLSNGEIAARLHLSEGTVKQYVSALFVELEVDNRVHAAVLASRSGLLDEPGSTAGREKPLPTVRPAD